MSGTIHADTLAFISALTGNDDTPCTWQVFPEGSAKSGAARPRILHGSVREVASRLLQANADGCGVFVTVNETDLTGRKQQNIVGVRAQFIDCDTVRPTSFHLEPSIVVESKAGPHAYFLVREAELVQFTPAQKRLAAAYGSDPKVCDLPRVMRVPGFFHNKEEPYMVRLVESHPERVYSQADVTAGLPEAPPRPPRSRPGAGAHAPGERYQRAALANGCDVVRNAIQGERNDTLLREARSLGQLVAGGVLNVSDVEEGLLSAATASGLSPEEAADAIQRGLTYGANLPRGIPEGRTHSQTIGGQRVEINLDGDRTDLTVAAAIDALAASDTELFQREGTLVQLVESRSDGMRTIRDVQSVTLIERLARVASVRELRPAGPGGAGEWVPTGLPRLVAEALSVRGQWRGVPHLEGLSAVPIVAPNGEIRDLPGYDPSTRLFFQSNVDFPPVPKTPTLEDAQLALQTLAAPFVDFPFADDVHRSAALSVILTGVARPCLDGSVPGFVIEANVRSTGKSLCANLIGYIIAGTTVSSSGFPEKEEERAKVYLSELRRGETVILFDDVASPIGGAALNRLLTAPRFSDRLLGSSVVLALPVRQVVIFTANNPRVVGDTARRVLPIRIVAQCERPEDRKGFKIPNVFKHVREARPALVVAALTAIRAWYVAGAPDMGLEPWGSFEAWLPIRNMLVWAGWPDPIGTRASVRAEEDEDLAPIREFLEALYGATLDNEGPLTAKDIAGVANMSPPVDLGPALAALPGRPVTLPWDARSVGYRLRPYKERVVGGMRLVTMGKDGKIGVNWSVEPVKSNG